jgi:hypothetical protein
VFVSIHFGSLSHSHGLSKNASIITCSVILLPVSHICGIRSHTLKEQYILKLFEFIGSEEKFWKNETRSRRRTDKIM